MYALVPTRTRAASAVAFACLTALLGGCGSSSSEPAAGGEPRRGEGLVSNERPGPAVAYKLSTHCGITEARYQDRYYELVPPLHDGNGNPPAGWGNPVQPGTLTPASDTEVVFTDDAGHRVAFTLRPGATTWKRLCD